MLLYLFGKALSYYRISQNVHYYFFRLFFKKIKIPVGSILQFYYSGNFEAFLFVGPTTTAATKNNTEYYYYAVVTYSNGNHLPGVVFLLKVMRSYSWHGKREARRRLLSRRRRHVLKLVFFISPSPLLSLMSLYFVLLSSLLLPPLLPVYTT